MRKFWAVALVIVAATSCAGTQIKSGQVPTADEPLSPFEVTLTDGRVIECVAWKEVTDASYRGFGFASCNWNYEQELG